jgi:hypothetical protein
MRAVPGVVRVIEARPGEGARPEVRAEGAADSPKGTKSEVRAAAAPSSAASPQRGLHENSPKGTQRKEALR